MAAVNKRKQQICGSLLVKHEASTQSFRHITHECLSDRPIYSRPTLFVFASVDSFDSVCFEETAAMSLLTGIVKSILSGDTVVLRNRPVSGPPKERQLILSNIAAPRMPKKDATGEVRALCLHSVANVNVCSLSVGKLGNS